MKITKIAPLYIALIIIFYFNTYANAIAVINANTNIDSKAFDTLQNKAFKINKEPLNDTFISKAILTGLTLTATNNTSCTQVCGNGSIICTPLGGTPPYIYQISASCNNTIISNNLIKNLLGDIYTVTVSDATLASASASITILDPEPIIVNINGINPSGGNNGIVTANIVSGGVAPFDYLWLPNGCNQVTCSNLSPGTYSLTVVDAQGCNASNSVTLSYPLAINNMLKQALVLYPNPVINNLHIKGENILGKLEVINTMGQTMSVLNNYTQQNVVMPITTLPRGIYFLKTLQGVYKFFKE